MKFGSTRNALSIWQEDQDFGLRATAFFGPEQVFVQRYEDLIANPENVLSALCTFMGLSFDKDMLTFYQRAEAVSFAAKGPMWTNISRPVMATNSRRYAETLSKRDIRSVEAYLGPYMDRFGYQRDFPSVEKPRKRDIFWPMLLEPIERWVNKDLTPFYNFGNAKYHALLTNRVEPIKLSYLNKTQERAPSLTIDRLFEASNTFRDRPALTVDGTQWSYAELMAEAAHISERIREKLPEGAIPVVGVYAARHWTAYAGILATLMAGGTFVPLNPSLPPRRNNTVLNRSRANVIIHCQSDTRAVQPFVDFAPGLRRIVLGDQKPAIGAPIQIENLVSTVETPQFVYILFTSGSTGEPKGVPVTHVNLATYLKSALAAITPSCSDRFSQTFDLTFDLAMHDLFVCWSSGAHLMVPSQNDLRDPAQYIARDHITQWFSVASLASTIRMQGRVTPNAFPSIKRSLFCGEALPVDLAVDWCAATPNGITENWYGPTEATIACTAYVIDPATLDDDGIVPIGTPFTGMKALVMNPDMEEVEGEIGTLYIGGPQVAPSYLNNPESSAQSFKTLPSHSGTFYNTGDLAMWRDGVLHYHGRSDQQVKIRGYRVELQEIETAMRRHLNNSNVVALAWPQQPSSSTHIVGAVEVDAGDSRPIMKALRDELPSYMIPASLFFFDVFPRNANGKIDRKAIAQSISERFVGQTEATVHNNGSQQRRLMDAIRSIKPSLLEDNVLNAESLMWAGMDSFDFVKLTLVLEDQFSLKLDHQQVAILANSPFSTLLNYIEMGKKTDLKEESQQLPPRANRALRFVEDFPFLLEKTKSPLVLAVGSSGTFRGFEPSTFEDYAHQKNEIVSAVNIGLPALNCRGLTRICRFIRDQCSEKSLRARIIIYELDPMIVSPIPPTQEIALQETVFSDSSRLAERVRLSSEFQWSADQKGYVAFDENRIAKGRRALWENKRGFEIADVYAGRLEFVEKSVQSWIEGARYLAEVTDTLIGFVHPLSSGADPDLSDSPDHFERLIARIKSDTGMRMLLPSDFNVPTNLFVNINHMEPKEGREVLTRQIGELVCSTPATSRRS